MIEELRCLLEQVPFQPFTIVTSSSQQYRVKSLDHIHLGPGAKAVGVYHDDGTFSVLSPLHMAAFETAARYFDCLNAEF